MGSTNTKGKIGDKNPETFIVNYYLENLSLENKNFINNNNKNIKEIYTNIYVNKCSKKEAKNLLYT
jgi:hypothetical protein